MISSTEPKYLSPYLQASRKYGSGFGSLLWASPKTQAIRFRALLSAMPVDNARIMDVGCGRADFLEYIYKAGRFPRSYTGIEAVEAMALAAERKNLPNCRIIPGDFLQDPQLLDSGAEILFYSGSLNTMQPAEFYRCIEQGLAAAKKCVVLNFLCSSFLAASSHLTWHAAEDVMAFAKKRSGRVKLFDNYLRGDATVAIFKDES